MMVEFKFFLLFLVLNVPQSLLQPLEASTGEVGVATNSDVLNRENNVDIKTPIRVKVNETIQQIDVKDEKYRVISDVKQIIINDSNNSVPIIETVVDVVNNDTDINKENDVNNVNTLATKANIPDDQNSNTAGGDEITPQIALKEDQIDNLNTTSDVSDKSDSQIQTAIANDTDVSWRLDIPKKKYKDITNEQVNDDLNVSNSTGDLILEPNSETENDFVTVNSGNIDRFSEDSPPIAEEENTSADNSTDVDDNSESISDLNNSTHNKIPPNFLQYSISDYKNVNSKNFFYIFNSGDILNVGINSPVPGIKNKFLRSRRNLNINKENLENLKTPILISRIGEDSNNNEIDIPDSIKSNNTDIINLLNETIYDPTVDRIGMIIIDAIKPFVNNENENYDEVTENPITESSVKPNNNNNKLLKPLLKLKQILDKHNLDIFGNSLDVIKRTKRDTYKNRKTDHEITLDTVQNEKSLDELCLSNKNCMYKHLLETLFNSSVGDDKDIDNTVLKSPDMVSRFGDYEPDNVVDIECPISTMIKFGVSVFLNKLADSKDFIVSTIYPIIHSVIENDQDPIDLPTLSLLKRPFPVKIRVQVLHGNTTDFINRLSKRFDTTLCYIYNKFV